MTEDINEKLEKMLESGEITRDMFDEMKSRWNDGSPPEVEETTHEEEKGGQNRTVIRISGSGVLSSPKAHEIHISGSGRVQGSVEADIMSISGSAKVEGSVSVKEKLTSSGSLRAGGDILSEKIDSSGALEARSVKASTLKTSGGTKVENGIEAEKMSSSGMLTASTVICGDLNISGTMKAETIKGGKMRIHGAIVSAEVEAESFELESMGWGTSIDRLAADSIVITSRKRLLLSGRQVDIVEIRGKKVDLENVNCGRIFAEAAVIGDSCNVDYVEAREISISEGANVKEKKITGNSD